MKSTIIFLSLFLSIISCDRNINSSDDIYINTLNIKSDFAGINTQKDYKTTYDDQNRISQILYQEIGYDDTIIVNYTIDYKSNGLPLKVYSQYLKSFGKVDSLPKMSIEFEYANDTLQNVIYDDGILGDLQYQEGNLKSLAYHYFDYNADKSKFIDTTRTRKILVETDSIGNIIRTYGKKQNKVRYNDVKMIYDSMPNPYYRSILSLIPEPDFISFFSKNNWIQTITNGDSSKIIESRSITYNKNKYPARIKLKHEFDFLTIDTITYK